MADVGIEQGIVQESLQVIRTSGSTPTLESSPFIWEAVKSANRAHVCTVALVRGCQ